MTKITVNGNQYSDDGSSAHDMQSGGYRTNLLPMLSDTLIALLSDITAATAQANIAANQANAAAASAATAVSAPGTTATSTTTLSIGAGVQSLTIQTGKSIVPGMQVIIASTAAPTNWMAGTVTSYVTGTGVLGVTVSNVSGAAAGVSAWTVALIGAPGVTGILNELLGAPIASAATINLTTATGNLVHVTGTTPITAITIPVGAERTVIFDGVMTLTYGAALLLPSGANITTAVGDRMIVRGDTAGANVIDYVRASGAPLAGGPLVRSPRAANTILAAADQATLVDITGGTFAQTFTAQATLGAGWYVYLRNSGAGNITLTPAGGLIDGLSSYVMYPQECRLIQCDGTNFNSIILHPYAVSFVASGTFTTPPGYAYHGGMAWSAGASGGREPTSYNAWGGGGGGCVPFTFTSNVLGASQPITIGAGGAPYTGSNQSGGTSGGNTTIGSLLTIYGAQGSTGGSVLGINTGTSPGVGFEPSNGASGGNASAYGGGGGSFNGTAQSSIYGGAQGGGIAQTPALFSAGTSVFGGNGGAASLASNGSPGTAPGGGGGATQTGVQSGAGARGEVRLWGIA